MQNPAQATERPGEVAARAQLFAKVYAQMGYAGMNVGAHELGYGLTELRAFGKAAKMPLLSANIRDAKTDKHAFEPYLVRQMGPLKVAVFGLVTPQPMEPGKLFADQGLKALDPVAVARDLVPELRKLGVDTVVVLSQLRRSEIEALANQVPGIDLVLGSMDMELTMQPLTLGKQALFADAFTKGKYIAEVTISVRGRRDRLYAANARDAKIAERADASRQVQEFAAQLESAGQPGSALQLNDETKKVLESQLVAARARQQRLTMEIEGSDGSLPADASTVDLVAAALAATVVDDPTVDKWVKAHQEKFPKVGGH